MAGPDSRRLCSPARQMAPAFYTYPFNKVAEEGDTVTLQCAVKGLPAPWATWDKDGVIITPSSRITLKEKDEIFRILELEQVTVDDVGVYRITVENEFGRAEASARIEVITQRGKFYGGVRAYSPSPRRSLTYRSRRPSTPSQDWSITSCKFHFYNAYANKGTLLYELQSDFFNVISANDFFF